MNKGTQGILFLSDKESLNFLRFPNLIKRYPDIFNLAERHIYIPDFDFQELPKNAPALMEKTIRFIKNYLPFDFVMIFKDQALWMPKLTQEKIPFLMYKLPSDAENNAPLNSMTSSFLVHLAQMFHQGDELNDWLLWKDFVYQFLKKKIHRIYVNDQVRVLYIHDMDSEGFEVSGQASYMHKIFKDFGGNHLGKKWEEKYQWISNIQIFDLDPDMIFLNSKNKKFNNISNSYLSNLNVYKTKKIYLIPESIVAWNENSIEDPLAWTWFSYIMYPKIFKEDLSCEFIEESYQFLYDFKLSKEGFQAIFSRTKFPECSFESTESIRTKQSETLEK